MELALEAKEDLMSLGVFHDVDMLIDTSAGNIWIKSVTILTFSTVSTRLLIPVILWHTWVHKNSSNSRTEGAQSNSSMTSNYEGDACDLNEAKNCLQV